MHLVTIGFDLNSLAYQNAQSLMDDMAIGTDAEETVKNTIRHLFYNDELISYKRVLKELIFPEHVCDEMAPLAIKTTDLLIDLTLFYTKDTVVSLRRYFTAIVDIKLDVPNNQVILAMDIGVST